MFFVGQLPTPRVGSPVGPGRAQSSGVGKGGRPYWIPGTFGGHGACSPAPGRTGACSRCAGAGSRRARRSACGGGPARRSRSAVRGRWGGSPRALPRPGPLPSLPRPPEAAVAACRPARRSRPAPSARTPIARAAAPRWRRARRCDGAGDRSRVRPRVGPFAQLEQHAARSRRDAGTRPGGRARPGAASRQSAGRPPPSAWPARRSGRRPRSRRGAGRDRGSRGNASAPRCRRARRSRRRPRCPPRRPGAGTRRRSVARRRFRARPSPARTEWTGCAWRRHDPRRRRRRGRFSSP